MSNLQDILNTMLLWVNNYLPEYAHSFQPGLDLRTLQEMFRDVDYVFPDDFYELYQWRNGTPDEPLKSLGPVFHFLPIEEVIEFKDWLIQDTTRTDNSNDQPNYHGYPVLPFIQSNCDYYGVVLGREYRNNAYVVMLDEAGDSTLAFDSITSLMESITACFETQAYYLNNEGFIEENEQLSAGILREKNPKVISEAVSSLERAVNLCIYDQSLNQESFSEYAKSLYRSLETLKPFRPPNTIQSLQETLAYLEQNRGSERNRHIYLMVQRWLSAIANLA